MCTHMGRLLVWINAMFTTPTSLVVACVQSHTESYRSVFVLLPGTSIGSSQAALVVICRACGMAAVLASLSIDEMLHQI